MITDVPGESFDRCETVYSIEEAVATVSNEQLALVIGGGMIYRSKSCLMRKTTLVILILIS